ncbi:MAG: GAF and ANTAR domain-containing protein [Actinomycetota bacterium]|nr:GAF and ANTAR domain-containing protein [Actinomycetota bacterium]MDQ2956339.1 GAF and ANTAR domain-containing protein [Actinomycetota bacterium]
MLELSLGFAELGNELSGAADNEAALHRIVELAVKFVQGCRCASIITMRGKQPHELASSDEIAAQLGRLQSELAEGPGLDAARLHTNYIVNDLSEHGRWPKFAELTVRATPIRSVLAFTLFSDQSAALTMYGEGPAGFSDEAVSIATIFAAQTSSFVALLAAEEHSANLETALQSSREIGIALGIVMAHRKITQEAAFDLLRAASQNLHRKLRDVAGEVMQTGALPGPPA